MADKILQTRIISKHTSLDLAKNSSFTPMEGEIVLVRVDTTKPDGHGGIVSVPTYLMKVGAKDSSGNLIALKDLQWTHAPASDVYAWAKAVKLNINDAASVEVANLDSAVFAGIKAAIEAKVDKTDYTGYQSTVTSKFAEIEQSIADLSGSAASNYATKTELGAVEDKADANAEAIAAINDGDTGILANANKHADDAVLAETNRATGAESALSGRIDAITNEDSGILANAKDYTDTEVNKALEAAGNAKTAADNAQSAADAAQGDVDALAGTVNTLSGNLSTEISNREAGDNTVRGEFAAADTQIRTDFAAADAQIRTDFAAADTALDAKITANTNAITAETNRATGAEGELAGRISTVEGKLANVTNVMDFRGAVTALPETADGYQNGDVIVVTDGDNKGKEYVVSDGAFVEFGNTDANAAAISDLQGRVTSVETNKADKTALTAEENARTAADTTLQGNIDTLSGTVTANKNAYDSYVTTNNNRVKAIEDDIANNVKADITANDTAIKGVDARVATIEGDYLKTADKYDDTAVRGLISDETSAREQADTALGGRIDNLSTTVTENKNAYDAYVLDNNGKVNKITGDLSELTTKVNGIDEAYKSADSDLAGDISALDGRFTTLEGEMDDVQTAVATKAEQSVVTGIDNRVTAVENNYIKVSGSNLVTQAGDVIIFDCGGVE